MGISCFFQSAADKSDIVGGTAAAAGLADDDSNPVCIVFSGQDSLHDLAYHHQGWIAGIVIYILQSHVYCLLVIIGQYLDVVAGSLEGRLQKLKMDRRHLRAENGVILTHLFGKGNLLYSGGVELPFFAPLFSDADGSQKRADPDPCSAQVVDLINLQ